MSFITELLLLKRALSMKCLPIPGKKLSTVLMCIVSLMVPIRNFVRASV